MLSGTYVGTSGRPQVVLIAMVAILVTQYDTCHDTVFRAWNIYYAVEYVVIENYNITTT